MVKMALDETIYLILVKRYNLHELHSYVWAYNDELKALNIPVENNVKLANATNPNIETIRNSIIPTQLCQVKTNASYSPDFGIFEIGRVVNGVDEVNNTALTSLVALKSQNINSVRLKFVNKITIKSV